MALDPMPRDTVVRLAALVLVVAVALAVALPPDVAGAALQRAAGDKSDGAGGFARLVEFLNHLADYAIPIGGAFSVLGLIWGGLLLQTGDARGGRVLSFVVLGVAIVLLAKPLAA